MNIRNVLIFTMLLFIGSMVFPACGKAQDTYDKTLYQNAPFNESITKLPPNYYGVDSLALFASMEKVFRFKTDYETTAAYKAHELTLEKQAVLGTVSADSVLAFGLDSDGLEATYDADKQNLKVTVNVDNKDTLTLFSYGQTTGSYNAHNAFGAEYGVIQVSRFIERLSISNSKALPVKWNGTAPESFSVNLSMDASAAQALSGSIGVLVVCKLTDEYTVPNPPYFNMTAQHTPPTVDMPSDMTTYSTNFHGVIRELLVYNVLTGDVLTTIKAK